MDEEEAAQVKNVKIFVRILPLTKICESLLKLDDNGKHRGIIARMLSDMLEEKRNRKYSDAIEYRMSYVEIYKNQVKDLLVGKNGRAKFNILPVNSEDETLKKIFEGEARKSIEQGETYDASHQGTSILTFHVSNTSLITSWAVATHSRIHIVDMAGFDSVGNSGCRKSAEQICNANLDKAKLEQFILALRNPNRSNIPRHSSNLLKYLGHAFELSSLLRFIAHIRVTDEDLILTLSTLRFASNVKKLKPKKIRYDVMPESDIEVGKLRENIARLRKELAVNNMLLHQEPLGNVSTARAKQIEQDAIDFLNGGLDDLMLLSLSQSQILLKTFKELFAKLEADHKVALEQAARDAYDLAAKDIKGSTLSLTKPSKIVVTSGTGKIRRKKSTGERLSKVTSSSSVGEDETVIDKVGEIEDQGIQRRLVRFAGKATTAKGLSKI
ncbi:kinesin-like protein KIF9 [Neodiprion pinetum]|uniref:kinesin-like protein KIF9 n=1 Tax=Neodiprion pinetum TaxID=441929 RepID=UPI001EE0BD26|nr:kinesin-like protein KIF6 [Neodiprion pinetum]